MGRRINSTGFCVGWSYFSSSEPPIMNFGDGDSQTVVFWPPGFPYQGAFFLRTNQLGSCANQYRVRVSTERPLFKLITWRCTIQILNLPSTTSSRKHEECHT